MSRTAELRHHGKTAPDVLAAETAVPRIYSGDRSGDRVGDGPGSGPAGGTNFVRGNRPLKRRKRSPFKLISMVAMVSLLIILYVWNKISVNKLAGDAEALKKQLEQVQNRNKELQSEIDKSMNLNRIREYSQSRLQMQDARDLPVWFDVPDYAHGISSGDKIESVINELSTGPESARRQPADRTQRGEPR